MAEPFRGIGGRPSAAELSRRLAAEIEDVTAAVLPDCRKEGSELRGHGSDGALWVVETRGHKRGVALCAADPERSGDALTLVSEALYGGDRGHGYAWALQRYGDGPVAPVARQAPFVGDAPELPDLRRRRARGRYIHADRRIRGTPAGSYLLGRGIPENLFGQALRFDAECFYAGRGDDQVLLPAMLAPVLEPISREIIACHCTYLAFRDGRWRKAAVKPARKVWAPFRGGLIPLLRGGSNKRLRDAPDGDGCLIAEGIENALSAAFLRPELRCFAAVSVGNLAAIQLPEAIASVCLVEDRDGENDAVRDAYKRAIDRWLNEGRGVEFIRPPGGHDDLNAWLCATLEKTGEMPCSSIS